MAEGHVVARVDAHCAAFNYINNREKTHDDIRFQRSHSGACAFLFHAAFCFHFH